MLKLLPLIAILSPAAIAAATLEAATSRAWVEYVRSATVQAAQRSRPGSSFLWADDKPDRLSRVRKGEIVVWPVGSTRVPSGLIHHWIGVVFIPQVTLRDVLHVVSDYGQYKDFYQPAVVSSKTIDATDAHARFSMMLVYNSLFLKAALDADYESRYIPVSDRSGYTLTQATRIQEIGQYGASEQHLLDQGEGHGILWGLFSVARYAERDGGVYLELEAIGLSRDIPASLRWFVEPVVRKVSRAAILTSLQQTKEAVRARVQLAGQNALTPVGN